MTNLGKAKGSKKGNKTSSTKGTSKDKFEVPPVIIKGGSIEVEFKMVDFDDNDNHTKVKKVKHPHNTKIVRVEIQDYKKNVLNNYIIPANLNGKCLIFVIDDAV